MVSELIILIPIWYTIGMEDISKQFEQKKESIIDFSNVRISYWSDEEINSFFDERIKALGNPEKFIEENKWQFDNFKSWRKDKGYSDSEMIKLFVKNEVSLSEEGKMTASRMRAEMEGKQEAIVRQVKLRLATFLPNWKPEEVSVSFRVIENANFIHPRKGECEIDLRRLSFEPNPCESVVYGITHELFHEWISERGLHEEEHTSQNSACSAALYNTVDEGLAVLVGGKPGYLEEHYKSIGKDYEKTIIESFRYLNEYLMLDDLKVMERKYQEGLSNMGPFYVVGFEMAKKVLESLGIERFREFVSHVRENPESLFDEYEMIAGVGSVLPKINRKNKRFL